MNSPNERGGPRELELRGRGDAAVLAAAEQRARAAQRAGRVLAERCELAGVEVYLKGDHLPGKARLRHGLRAALLGQPLPRLREHDNLAWLRARGFEAPEPLAAGALLAQAWPRYQFLATRWLAGEPLAAALRARTREQRLELARALGAIIGRLHALGFVHRDLFPRNLLVLDAADAAHAPRIALLDAWRGGARAQLRGPAWDLGCLFAEGAGLLAFEEQLELLRAYQAARTAAGRAAALARLLRAAARERRELVRRELRRADAAREALAADFAAEALLRALAEPVADSSARRRA